MSTFKSKKTYLLSLLFMLFIALNSVFDIYIDANEGGIAITGSLNGSNIKMVPGETFETDGVFIMIQNTYDVDIVVNVDVRLQNEENDLVEGLNYLFDLGEQIVKANSNFDFPVKFEVEEFMLPGKYTISIGASLVSEYTPGIVAVPVVRQRASLEIFGEAGDFTFNFIDPFLNPFEGQIEIFRVEDTRLTSVATSFDSTITDRYVPGTYVVEMKHAYDDNEFIVYKEEFELFDGDVLSETFVVQTTFLDSFVITPLLGDEEELLNAILNYRIRNVYQEIEDVSISLEILYKGERIERFIIQEVNLLGLGLSSYRTNYVPPEGWQNGIYTFNISVFALGDDNQLVELLVSEPYDINVTSMPTDALPLWAVILGSAIVASLGIVLVIILLKRKTKSTDIICLDDDPAYLEALAELIDGGKS